MFDAVYSDPHFGHKKIHLPDYADRPFSSTEEMREELIRRYNIVVSPLSTVLWLGDSFLCPADEARGALTPLSIMLSSVFNGFCFSLWMTSVSMNSF